MSNPPYPTSSMFNGSSHNTFKDATFIIQSERMAAFDKLEMAASPSAFHSFVGRPQPGKCYPNTRVALLDGLEKWAMGMELPEILFDAGLSKDQGINTGDQLRNLPIMWLKGGAGAGKSAVAQTFAERCEDLGHIVASFFFFSTDPTRNHANRLVATLAYQIAQADPGARARIEALIYRDPHLFDKDFNKQITSLIVDPLQHSMQTPDNEADSHRPCTIIIDGLDECTGGDVQAGIIRAVCDALRAGSTQVQKKLPHFLICSRPEEPITRAFHSPNLLGMYTCTDLSSDTNASADIRTFFEGKFTEIRMSHPRADLIPASWPSRDNLFTLEWNSSGHFIYAQTVVRLVSNDARPVAALEGILGLRALPQRVREPWAELDELYRHILLRALEKTRLDTILIVLGFASIGGPAPYGLDIIATFLNLEDGELDTFLSTASSLVFMNREIRFYHKTLYDFLDDELRAREFYIDDNEFIEFIWARCVYMSSREASLDEKMCEFVKDCAFTCYNSVNIRAGEQSYSLLGLIQRRDFSIFLKTSPIDRGSWSAYCFGYWLELSRSAKNNTQIIEEAISVMIGILKDLTLYSGPTVPLVMCQYTPSISRGCGVFFTWSKLSQDAFAAFLRQCIYFEKEPFTWGHCQTYFSDLERCLEDEDMGDHCLTAERYAEACLSWMTYLTKEADWFPCRNKQVLENQHSLILNESARRQRTPFLWRSMKQTVRPHQINGRLHFLWSLQRFNDDRGNKLAQGCTHRELLFGSRSNMVFPNKCNSSSTKKERDLGPSHFSGRLATPSNGPKTTVRGYTKVRHLSSKLFFLPRAKLGVRHFEIAQTGKVYDDDFGQDYHRRDAIRFVLSRLPIMLSKASKSDAVAALRSKALPPLARCFRRLTERVQLAMEEYAARHDYVSPYIDAGPSYTAGVGPQEESLSGNQLAVSTEAPSGEVIAAYASLVTSILICGQKRPRPTPVPRHATHPSGEICAEPGCEEIISEKHAALNCSSPECARKYHLMCQGMTEAPLAEWFCDEECERDAAVRKRRRYRL